MLHAVGIGSPLFFWELSTMRPNSVRRPRGFHVRPVQLLIITILFCCSRLASAGCAAPDLDLTMPATTYTGGADGAKPGTQLGSESQSGSGTFDLSTCSPAKGARTVAFPAKLPVPGVTYSDGVRVASVYPTGVTGIGYVLLARDRLKEWMYVNPPSVETYSGAAWDALGMEAKVLFVVTGRLKSGTYTVPAQQVGTVNAYNTAGSSAPMPPVMSIRLANSTVTVTAATCRMVTPVEQLVALPAVSKDALPKPGARAGASSFHIGLNCDADMKVYATMTDASLPTSTGETLSLASGSTAAGVGVQVFRDGLSTPVSYGPDSSVLGNTNQWQVGGSTTATTYTIPFVAGYVRTMDALRVGSVSAKATITFSYQ